MTLTYRKRQVTKGVILHATHTPPSQSRLEDFLRVEGRRRGLLDIGYHFLIDRDGRPLSTRPHDTIGSHCPGYNWGWIGVALAGGVSEAFSPYEGWDGEHMVRIPEDNFTPAQGSGLRDLMRYLTEAYGPPLPLMGHSELPKHQHRERRCPPMDMEGVREWVLGRS
jgi:hypothetical protein